MRVTINPTFDIETRTLESHDGQYEHDGPVAQAKGQDTAKAQLDLQNQLTKQQMDQQKAIRDQILQVTGKYTTGAGEGYDPAGFAAMISQFMNQNSQNFNQAGGVVRSALAARGAGGGDMPVGGDFTRGIATLEGAKASSQAQGILGLNVQNEIQRLNNKFNALGLQSGQGAQLGQNIGTFNQGANSSLNSYVTAANSSPLMDMIGKVAGAGLGAFTGSIGTQLGNKLFTPQKSG